MSGEFACRGIGLFYFAGRAVKRAVKRRVK
jgi:hypothetical protein